MATNEETQFDGSAEQQEHKVVFNGVEIPIEIELEENGRMSPVQTEALRIALSPAPDVLQTSAPAVLQNYEVYREMLGDDELPPLNNPVDVWQGVAPSYISIPPHGEVATPTFLLLAECDWDPEHGLLVRFRNGVADASSQQGELDLED